MCHNKRHTDSNPATAAIGDPNNNASDERDHSVDSAAETAATPAPTNHPEFFSDWWRCSTSTTPTTTADFDNNGRFFELNEAENKIESTRFEMLRMLVKGMVMMNEENVDEETIREVERMIVLRVSTKHINLWMRQLEMKRKEIGELAGLMGFGEIKKEVETEKDLEKWGKRSTNCFTKKMKRMIYGEIDNMVWNGGCHHVSRWSEENKVYEEITEEEIDEIWKRGEPDEDENIRLNGKHVWETAKRVCDFINTHTKTSSPSQHSENTER